MQNLRKTILLLGIFVLINITYQVSRIRRPKACPKRTDLDGRCRKECTSNKDCRSTEKRKKACLCDGLCGLSCIRLRRSLCREDRNVVTKLRRGKVLLNGKPYEKTNFKFGDVITYTCKRGFKLTGPSKVTCSGIGKWKPWDKGTPSCRRACPDPGNPKDGRRFGDSFDVGKRIRFRCNPGYKMIGSRSATCLSTLQWNARTPKCQVSSCGNPKLPANGRIYRGQQEVYQYGDRVYLSCESGYFRRGSSLIICDLNGWRGTGSSPASCLPKSCGSPGSPRNGDVEGTLYSYKSIVKFSCKDGYELKGATYRICLQNQRWSGSVPTCEPVDCGVPKDIENGSFKGFGTKFNDDYYVECLSGYVLSGSKEITCLANGKWNSEPKCSLVTCDSSYSSIDNGKVIGNDAGAKCTNTYNCRLSFECDVGYYLSDRQLKHSVCEVNGKWTNLKPTCQPVFCGKPDAPWYGLLTEESKNFYYPSTVRYTCNAGYDLVGDSSRKCLATGQWSGDVPFCRANCGDPGKPEHGQKYGNTFTQGNYVRFTCDKGYDLIGEVQIVCQRNDARWSSSKPECKARDCGHLGSITGGRITTLNPSFKFPSVIRYECSYGYDMDGSNVLKCEADGSWSKTPSCTANCGDPGKPENGNKAGSDFKKDGIVRFTCNNGYNLIGSREITCQQKNARWSSPVPTCEPRDCGDPRPIKGGRLQGFPLSFKFPSVVQYECLDGYDMDGPSRLQCQADGQWTRRASCIANCGDPGKPENGNKEGSNFKMDGIVRFTCNNGYNLIGSREIMCQQKNAKWLGSVPACEVKDCGKPVSVDGGRIIGNVDTTYASVVRYECLDGYDMDGQNYTKCRADGSWTKEPKCIGKPCEKPPTLKDGKILDPKKRYSFPDAIKYECNYGFTLAGRYKIECDKNGNWSKLDAQCNEIICRDPEELEQGNIVPDSNGAGYKFGNEIQFQCNLGYRLNGEKTSECLEEGWTGLKRSCSEITCQAPKQIINGNFAYKESLTSDGKFRLNSEVTYICNSGYELKGDKRSTCGEAGWSMGQRSCDRVTCAPPNIANGEIKDERKVYQIGDKAQVGCKPGFQIESADTKEIKCEDKTQWSSLPKCVPTVGSCDKSLGMESGAIKDDQITFERSHYKSPNEGRLNGRIWCGTYVNGAVRVTIKFKSVVTITSVLFQSRDGFRRFMAAKVRFRYLDADNAAAGKWLRTRKIYQINRSTALESKVIIGDPIKTSHFEMILMRNSIYQSYACDRFELFGCQAKTTCNIPQAPENGEALGMIYKEGSQAVYSCNQGYALSNDDKQTCTATGNWTGNTSSCIKDTTQIGCYKKDGSRRLFTYIGDDYEPDGCVNKCKERGYSYAGLKYSNCLCGTVYPFSWSKVKTDDRECYLPCKMDPSRKCGGPYRMSIYSIY